MIKAIILAAAVLGEHWVCGVPTLVDPAHINLFDFDTSGDDLVVHAPGPTAVNLRYHMLRNDDRAIVVEWPTLLPAKHGLAVIDKVLGSFKVYVDPEIVAGGNVEGLISAEGSCLMFGGSRINDGE